MGGPSITVAVKHYCGTCTQDRRITRVAHYSSVIGITAYVFTTAIETISTMANADSFTLLAASTTCSPCHLQLEYFSDEETRGIVVSCIPNNVFFIFLQYLRQTCHLRSTKLGQKESAAA